LRDAGLSRFVVRVPCHPASSKCDAGTFAVHVGRQIILEAMPHTEEARRASCPTQVRR
jgi:hypothetical protein